MKEYVVGQADKIEDNSGFAVQAGKRVIAVFKVSGDFYAMHNACPHKGANMCDGEIKPEEKIVRCPWHNWAWELETGKLDLDERQGIRMYECFVDGNDVIVRA